MAVRPGSCLVFSSVGQHSSHSRWLKGARRFDLVLVDYEGNCPEAPDYKLWRRAGTKWENLAFLAEVWPALQEYDVVACLDDDLVLDGPALQAVFEVILEHDLRLAQPSLRLDSAFSWSFTLQRPFLKLRFVGFVENGLTFFRGRDLACLLPVCRQARSGYGLDWVLPKLLQAGPRSVAVVDEVCAYHPARPSDLDRRWSREQQRQQGLELCQQFGAEELEPSEAGFILNARGQAWVEQGGTPELVYAAAHRFVLHEMGPVLRTFRPVKGG